MGVTVHRGRILVIGGIINRQEFTNTGYWWDPDSNHWEEAPALNEPRASFGLISDGLIWAIGGVYIGPSNRIEVFRAGSWEELPRANLPEPRGEMGAAYLNDSTIVVAGGTAREGATEVVIAFSPRTGAWRRLPPMARPRLGFPLIALDGKLYAIGGGRHSGERVGGLTNEVEVLSEFNSAPPKPELPLSPAIANIPVWPNPGNGRFLLNAPIGGRFIEIWNPAGRLVYSSPIASGTCIPWDAEGLPASVYQIRVLSGSGIPIGSGRAVLTR